MAFSPSACHGEGRWGREGVVREGGVALDLVREHVREDAGLDSPESSSLVSEQSSGTTVPDSPCGDRGCRCRGRG